MANRDAQRLEEGSELLLDFDLDIRANVCLRSGEHNLARVVMRNPVLPHLVHERWRRAPDKQQGQDDCKYPFHSLKANAHTNASARSDDSVQCDVGSLCQCEEVVHTDASLLQDVGKRGSLDGPVGGDGELERLRGRVLLQANVAAFLSDNNPAVTLESADDPIIGQAWDLAHTATSSCSAFGMPAVSSSTGSRYSSIASRMFASASSLVSPSLMQPGKEGTVAVNPPSSLGSRFTLRFISHLQKEDYPFTPDASISKEPTNESHFP